MHKKKLSKKQKILQYSVQSCFVVFSLSLSTWVLTNIFASSHDEGSRALAFSTSQQDKLAQKSYPNLNNHKNLEAIQKLLPAIHSNQ